MLSALDVSDTHFNALEELGAHCIVSEEGILEASTEKTSWSKHLT